MKIIAMSTGWKFTENFRKNKPTAIKVDYAWHISALLGIDADKLTILLINSWWELGPEILYAVDQLTKSGSKTIIGEDASLRYLYLLDAPLGKKSEEKYPDVPL